LGKEDRPLIQRILVPIDGSDHSRKVIELASDIASRYKAEVHIVHVVSPLDRAHELADNLLKEVEKNYQDFAQTIIDEAEREFKKKDVESYQSAILRGDPAQEILQFAEENGVDMIVMGSRGAGAADMLMFGSVSHKVCHLCECTCITVK
jgi:nucleotide-binding universal stress UspA family protein